MRVRTKSRDFSVPSQVNPGGIPSGGVTGWFPKGSQPIMDYQDMSPAKEIPFRIREVKTIKDVVTPHFHSRLRAGEVIPTNIFEKSIELILLDSGYPASGFGQAFQYVINDRPTRPDGDYMTAGNRWVHSLIGPPTFKQVGGFSQEEINAVSTEAMAKLHSQGLDALTSAAEFHKTLAMIANFKRNLLTSLGKLGKMLRRDWKKGKYPKPKTIKELIEQVSALWLEFRFGWRILYYDMREIDKWFRNRDKKWEMIVGRSSTSRDEEYHTQHQHHVIVRTLKVGHPALLDRSVLGYGNVLNTAWDIIPFSLVVDWFFNVQETILAHMTKPRNVKGLPASAFVTQFVRKDIYNQAKAPDFVGPFSQVVTVESNMPAVHHTYGEWVKRWNPGQPALTLPTFTGGPQGYQWLDLAAIIKAVTR